MKKLIAALVVAVGLSTGGAVSAVPPPCDVWFTYSTTAKSYGPCNQTTIGPWTSPVGGCLQWVSWRVTQRRINDNGGNALSRTYLHNEVRAVWKVTVGPVTATKTQTMPGSHTTTLVSGPSILYGSYACNTGGSSGTW